MARNCIGRYWLPTFVTAAILTGLGPIAWGQPAETWRDRLRGDWCDAERGCTHWWTHFVVSVDSNDNIEVRYRDQRFFVFFRGQIQEPVGRWTIKARTKDGHDFEATVSELESLKELVQGKIKGSLTAKIQAANIEGIIVHEKDGIATISKAEIDEPKITKPKADKVTIDKMKVEKAEMKNAQTDGPVLKGADKVEAEQMSAEKLEANTLKATKIVGKSGREVEISIPIQISEATIVGIAKPKKDNGKKEEGEDDQEGPGKKRMELKGEIKGKITSSTGTGDLKGDFEGTFTAVVQAVVKGSYGVPPPACSEAGRLISEEEKADLAIRRKERSWNVECQRRFAQGKKECVPEERPGRYFSEKEGTDIKKFPLFVPVPDTDKTRLQPFVFAPVPDKDRKDAKLELFVDAGPTKAPRPAEPHSRGRFMRKVTGTVSAVEPATITLDLPPLPVLDHKCSVIDELPKRTVKLVKQHHGVR